MESVRVLGIQVVDFIANNGDRVAGTKIHYACKDENVDGMAAETVFIRKDSPIAIPAGIVPGGNAIMNFNRKGKLTELQASSKPAK